MRILFVVIVGVLLGASGCKKTPPTSAATEQPPSPPPAGHGNTNYIAGGGALQNVRQAARRAVALNDMHQIGIFITQWEIENNRMPSKNEVYTLLSQTPNLKKLIDDGDVILTGTNKREGLWAYEIEADVKGGLGLVTGVANRYSAEDIKQYLGR